MLRRRRALRSVNRTGNAKKWVIFVIFLIAAAIITAIYVIPQFRPTPHYCCKINLKSKGFIEMNVSDERQISFTVTNSYNYSIVEGLAVRIQSFTPDGRLTDKILVKPKELVIEPLGAGGTSRVYILKIRTENTPPGKYYIELKVVYKGRDQSEPQRIWIDVKYA